MAGELDTGSGAWDPEAEAMWQEYQHQGEPEVPDDVYAAHVRKLEAERDGTPLEDVPGTE